MSTNTDIAVGRINTNKKSGSSPDPLYIVLTEDFRKAKTYLSSRQNRDTMVVTFKGFEVDAKKISQLTTWDDALAYAEEIGIKLTELTIPWNRIIIITNVTYRQKKA